MGDLEDAFLKKNIPGRYSSWADEHDDKRNNDDNDDDYGGNDKNVSDSEDDDYYFQGLPSNNKESQTSALPPPSTNHTIRKKGNTGVKGVLADYREAQQQEQLRKEEERLEAWEALYGATHPAVRSECSVSNNQNNKNDKKINNNDDSDGSDVDDSDDEFLKQFRNQRLAQLQSTVTAPSTVFGSLTLASPEEYVQLVDEMDPQLYLIVHLYESAIQQCRMLHSALEKVATCMTSTKFIEVQALEANPNLDTIVLPAILVYKRGELVHNLVRFTEELPRGYGVEEVREVLEGLLVGRGGGFEKC